MIRLIAAIDRERGIAKCGCIPWKIPSDERYFTELTKKYGGSTLNGRVTFETYRRPLAERRNYVLTHQQKPIPGVELVHDLGSFLQQWIPADHDLWVVGGAAVFEQTIAVADELYLTPIDALFGCDRLFPEYKDTFRLVSQGEPQEENGFHYHYEVWRRKP